MVIEVLVRGRLTKREEKRKERVHFFSFSSKPPPFLAVYPFSYSRVAMPYCRACSCILPCLFSYGLARCDQVCALAGTPFNDKVSWALTNHDPSLPSSPPPHCCRSARAAWSYSLERELQ